MRVVQVDKDRYGRIVGQVFLGNMDVNAEQVKRGMAWVYPKYARDPKLYEFEREAKIDGRGLWRDKNATPPWEYRRARRG